MRRMDVSEIPKDRLEGMLAMTLDLLDEYAPGDGAPIQVVFNRQDVKAIASRPDHGIKYGIEEDQFFITRGKLTNE